MDLAMDIKKSGFRTSIDFKQKWIKLVGVLNFWLVSSLKSIGLKVQSLG